MVEGDESGAFLLPAWALGDYGNANIAIAVGGVTLFLEGGSEISVCGVPATINVDGVCRGERLGQFHVRAADGW